MRKSSLVNAAKCHHPAHIAWAKAGLSVQLGATHLTQHGGHSPATVCDARHSTVHQIGQARSAQPPVSYNACTHAAGALRYPSAWHVHAALHNTCTWGTSGVRAVRDLLGLSHRVLARSACAAMTVDIRAPADRLQSGLRDTWDTWGMMNNDVAATSRPAWAVAVRAARLPTPCTTQAAARPVQATFPLHNGDACHAWGLERSWTALSGHCPATGSPDVARQGARLSEGWMGQP